MKKLRVRQSSVILNLIFYVVLLLLAMVLLYPYTSFCYSQPFFIPFNKKLNEYDVILEKGESFRLYPLSLSKKTSYSSSDFKVAEVNNTGRVAARKCGQAVIRVKTRNGASKCRVRVVELNYKKLAVKKGEAAILKVQGYQGAVKFHSRDKKIVMVEGNGKMIGINQGRTYVTAQIKNKKLVCKITVE